MNGIVRRLFLFLNEENISQTHSLIFLASQTSIPDHFKSFLRLLTPKFVDTRYPDAAVGLPYELYTREETLSILNNAEEVIKWIQDTIQP